MSSALHDKIKVTAGKHAGRTGVVVNIIGGRPYVRVDPPPRADGKPVWPFPELLVFELEDLQRINA